MKQSKTYQPSSVFRLTVVYVVIAIAFCILLLRMIDLQILNKDFLQKKADARHLRVLPMLAHRGMILDRNGSPLAVSTPVDSIWVQPKIFSENKTKWPKVVKILGLNTASLNKIVKFRLNKEFVYIKRKINPEIAKKVLALNIPGLSLQREYRRYYPMAEVTSHVLGFTNVDDIGQEGIELAYNNWLNGIPGKKRVMKDRLGRVIKDIEQLRAPIVGKNITLTIDRRLQYLAYRELKRAVFKHKAKSGSAVILDVATGEVLAMVNQPSFNPNNRATLKSGHYRNRAVTDVFEPGSTVKPFTVAAALKSGKFSADSMIDTSPGYFMVAGNTVRDSHNYGRINVATIIKKSSNVGISKLSFSTKPELLWDTFSKVGFGNASGSGFPGESNGLLKHYSQWKKIEQATLSFGYGISVTALQLAHAYTVFSMDGSISPVTFVKRDPNVVPHKEKIFNQSTVKQVLKMLESVVSKEGTGYQANVIGYRVAGKTGTVKKASIGGYSEDNYLATFVGVAPATNPKLAMAIIIDQPSSEEYYGGQVAAPVFSRVMSGALRLLNVPLDIIPQRQVTVASIGDAK